MSELHMIVGVVGVASWFITFAYMSIKRGDVLSEREMFVKRYQDWRA